MFHRKGHVLKTLLFIVHLSKETPPRLKVVFLLTRQIWSIFLHIYGVQWVMPEVSSLLYAAGINRSFLMEADSCGMLFLIAYSAGWREIVGSSTIIGTTFQL